MKAAVKAVPHSAAETPSTAAALPQSVVPLQANAAKSPPPATSTATTASNAPTQRADAEAAETTGAAQAAEKAEDKVPLGPPEVKKRGREGEREGGREVVAPPTRYLSQCPPLLQDDLLTKIIKKLYDGAAGGPLKALGP